MDVNASYDNKVSKQLKSTSNKNQKSDMVNCIDQTKCFINKEQEKIIPLRMRETKISEEFRPSYENEKNNRNIISNQNMSSNTNLQQRPYKNKNNLG
jgi:hypothetical protein